MNLPLKFFILLVFPGSIEITQIAVITSRLKAAEPTIVPGPKSPAKNSFPQISITESKISGALLPNAIRVKFATVSFQLQSKTKYICDVIVTKQTG
jgi:hypothetical protein